MVSPENSTSISNRLDPQSTEVHLGDISYNLRKSKWLILFLTLSCSLLAFAYTQIKTVIYIAEAEVSPVSATDLENYNLANRIIENTIYGDKARVEPTVLVPKEVYVELHKNLNSLTVLEEFFDKFYLPALSQEEREAGVQWNLMQLHKRLRIREMGLIKPDALQVEFEDKDSEQAQRLLKLYLDFANQKTIDDLNKQLLSRIDAARKQVQLQLSSARETAEQERKYQIARLNAALEIAEKINLKKPTDDGSILINFDEKNLYLKGSDALKAELAILSQRRDNDAHIKDLSLLLDKQALLRNLPEDITIVRAAKFEPNRLTKVKGLSDSLTIGLGAVLGLLIGLFIVIVRTARR
ncbi:hypothetical protein CLH39_01895 [Alcaligenes faecalis]|uniref:Wzz/FepE/Etk N-terminal domain-containing protein n=1 Tax=Alcaligenes faecalis TaxID=511 RepID=UPI0019345ABC|nr:Wzz/FepE/Etk N-terminal domain-containing protein [Alcaligenes faecalis]QRF89059.1 hypothetical protein CLH39_01895 [Alcaligenes faecalis]